MPTPRDETINDNAERCKRIMTNGNQCRRLAVTGTGRCVKHGSGTKAALAAGQRRIEQKKQVARMSRFNHAIGVNDPEVDPVAGFEMEYRKTIGRIRWLEQELTKLQVRDLTFGLTKREEINATEYAGVNTTYETRENVLYGMLKWERTHLLAIEKIFLSTKLDQARIEVQKQTLDLLDVALAGALSALGHDPNDPDVREVVMRAILAIPTPKALEQSFDD